MFSIVVNTCPNASKLLEQNDVRSVALVLRHTCLTKGPSLKLRILGFRPKGTSFIRGVRRKATTRIRTVIQMHIGSARFMRDKSRRSRNPSSCQRTCAPAVTHGVGHAMSAQRHACAGTILPDDGVQKRKKITTKPRWSRSVRNTNPHQ
jgi:hypothetical protein